MKAISDKRRAKLGGGYLSSTLARSQKAIKRNAKLRAIGKAAVRRKARYQEYMRSSAWKAKRIERLIHDRIVCQSCGAHPWPRFSDIVADGFPDAQYQVNGKPATLERFVAEMAKGWTVDHKTYARFRDERLEDLQTLCRSCHNQKDAMKVSRAIQVQRGRKE